ncbi:MAG: TRAP transporter large permease subunit [Deltaproteobacteria bacterium]|nr:TRAP transporter large permease subunit [Deltaproteobacteria bacterium]
MLTIGLILLFVVAVIVGSPLFTIIGGAAVLLFKYVALQETAAVIIEMGRLANAPGITAIPLFIFAGYIFAESKASSRMIRISNAALGWLPGGLAVVCAIASSIFTALTGASGITIIAVGGITLPAMIAAGYKKDFALGIVTASGSSGVLIAPSLPIIIYGMIAQTDITQLFTACLIPAFIIILCLSLYGIAYGIRSDIQTDPFSVKELASALWEAKWELPLPFIVVGGIYGGIITVGEAAAATAVYALLSECLIYRELPVRQILKIGIDSMVTVGSILIVLGCALGLDPVHLGVIFLANLELGYLTPPVGVNLFIASLRFDVSVMKLYKVTFPFLMVLLGALLLITYVPDLSLWLVEALGQKAEVLPM